VEVGHHSTLKSIFLLAIGILLAAAPAGLNAGEADSGTPDIRVTLLGTGVPVPNPRQMGQSILVEAGGEKLLFDCGRGCLHRLWSLGPEYVRTTHNVFLTHLHSDHTVGMADLLMNGWVLQRKMPLHVYGPDKTLDLMHHLRLAFDQDVVYKVDLQASTLSRDELEFSVTEVANGEKVSIGDVEVTPIRVDHHVVKPAFGYRIDYAGRSVVISGDTAYSENLVQMSQGVDVLIHEVMSPALETFVRAHYAKFMADDVVALHTRAPEAGEVFARAGPKLAVYTHLDNRPEALPELISQTREAWDGPLEVGEDLMVIEIGDDVDVFRAAAK